MPESAGISGISEFLRCAFTVRTVLWEVGHSINGWPPTAGMFLGGTVSTPIFSKRGTQIYNRLIRSYLSNFPHSKHGLPSLRKTLVHDKPAKQSL